MSSDRRLLRPTTTLLAVAALSFGGPSTPVLAGEAPASAEKAAEDEAPSDKKIRMALAAEYFGDDAVPAFRIDIACDKGTITLTGDVKSLAAKERAVELAKTMRGVTGVIDRIAVKAPKRADEGLVKDVRAALRDDPATDSYEVVVQAKDGTVTLTGEVDSFAEFELTEKVASAVRGVRAVENRTTFDPADERPDHEIAADVKARLETDVWLDSDAFQVRASDGTVQVTGSVGSLAARDRVRRLAYVAGTDRVDVSSVVVHPWKDDPDTRDRPPEAKDDRAIETAIRSAFVYDPRVFSFHPDIDVEDGLVTLSGTVDNLAAREAAEDDAMNTVGVWHVRNHLKVRPLARLDDAALAANVKRALERDVWLASKTLTIQADDGNVTLTGDVDSEFEKAHAARVASRLNGVETVRNRLLIRPLTIAVKSDAAIRKDIQDEFFWSPYVDGDQVHVTVQDGVATLTGSAESWHERRMATLNAKEGGALVVKNRIEVAHGKQTVSD